MKAQIEEMAKRIANFRRYGCTDQDHCDMSCRVYGSGCIPYEDAEVLYNAGYRKQSENMIEFPCKVGDTVYFPMETDGECNPYVDVGTVFALGIDERHTIWISVRYESGMRYYHTSDDFGKTVFLAQEEAEAALAKMKGGAE